MEAREALKSHNEIAINGLCDRVKKMVKDSEMYGTYGDTYRLVILENEIIYEGERTRDDLIQAKVFTINIEMKIDTI